MPRRLRVRFDLQVAHSAERRAQLVLDPLSTPRTSTSSRWATYAASRGDRSLAAHCCLFARQGNRHRSRTARAATGWDGGADADLHGHSPGGWEHVDGGLQQAVAGHPGRSRARWVAVAEALSATSTTCPEPPFGGSRRLLPASRRCSGRAPARRTTYRSTHRCHRSALERSLITGRHPRRALRAWRSRPSRTSRSDRRSEAGRGCGLSFHVRRETSSLRPGRLPAAATVRIFRSLPRPGLQVGHAHARNATSVSALTRRRPTLPRGGNDRPREAALWLAETPVTS